jgi:hypothetical protein
MRLTVSQTSDSSARSTKHQAGVFDEINNDKRPSSDASHLADLGIVAQCRLSVTNRARLVRHRSQQMLLVQAYLFDETQDSAKDARRNMAMG